MKVQASALDSNEKQLPHIERVKSLQIKERGAEIIRLWKQLKENVEIDVVFEMRRALPEILSGKIEPSDVLLKDSRLDRIYTHGRKATGAYDQLARILDLFGHRNPSLKVFEVGAGKGGATSVALDVLGGKGIFKRYSEYTYSDISSAFFPEAAKKFAGYKDVFFKTLDIETTPDNQGFETGTFDIIISANV